MPALRHPSVASVVLVAALGAAIFAQGEQRPIFRAGVEVFEVEVTVLDKDRRPVTGLRADDFTVFEDGKPARVVQFAEVEVPEREGPLLASEEIAAPDVTSTKFTDRRLFALVLDDFGMPFTAGGGMGANALVIPEVKRIARQIVQSLGPKDFAAVMLTRDPRNYPDFTNMWSKLTGAIDQFKPPGEAEAAWLYQATRGRVGVIAALKDAIYYMAKLPQHSKSIIYVGNPPSIDFSRRQFSSDAGRIEDVFAAARDAGIGISGFDVSRPLDRSSNGLLLTMAENTGGHAVGYNNLDAGVVQVFAENHTYYLLGFEATGLRDGKLRRLDVKIDRPGVTVRARRTFNAPAPPDMVKASTPFDAEVDAAVTALSTGGENRQVFTTATARPGGPIMVSVEIPLRESSDRAWLDGADVEVAILDRSGGVAANARGRIAAGARGLRLDVPLVDAGQPIGADRAPFRASVKVRGTGRVAEEAVAVVEGAGPSLGPARVSRAPVSPRAPLSPVAEFQFMRTERIYIEWPELQTVDRRAARLLRRNGEPTTFAPPLTEAENGGARSLSTSFPLGQLGAGEYVVELIVGRGEQSERALVAFRVVQ